MKKIAIILLLLCFCFVIFKITFNSKLDYLALGDDLSLGKTPFGSYGKSFSDFFANYLKNKKKLKTYNNKFLIKDYRTTDLIQDIKENKTITLNNKTLNINQAIVNADIITLSIGINDLFYKLNYNNIKNNQINTIYSYVSEMINDITISLNSIRKLNDCDIYIIGYYNPLIINDATKQKTIDNIFEYINNEFYNLETIKKVYYIQIKDGFDEKSYYLPNKKINFPSLEGYNYISNRLIEVYEKKE